MLSKGTKRFAITILVFALIVGAFVIFGGKKTPGVSNSGSSSGLTTSSGEPVVPGGETSASASDSVDEFAVLLSTIQNISIDTSLFQDQAYLALKDNPIQLGTDNVGRNNPFAPIGNDPVTAASSGINITTIQPGKITSTTAEFAAQVTLGDTSPVSVVFEYGPTDSFGSSSAPLSATHSGSVFFTATNLTPATVYYVRAVGSKGSVTTPANIMSFTTAAATKQ